MANELQLAAGLKLTNPAPADAYYVKPQVGQAPAEPYVSAAEACTYVIQAVRHQGLRVFVAGIGVMCWSTTDLSDSGLLPQDNGPGGGGSYSTAPFEYEVTEAGEVTIQLPAGTTGIDYPVQKQTPNPAPDGEPATTGQTTPINIGHTSFSAATGILTISADASLVPGQIITGIRQYGGGTGGDAGTGDIDAGRITGVLEVDQLPIADDAYIAQLFAALQSRMDQRYQQL